MTSSKTTALLAAAGQGTRLGAEVPKAFVTLRGRSLVERCASAMITSGVVDEIIVLVSPEMAAFAEELFARRGLSGIRFVPGGGERADSVWAGLQAISAAEGIVLIHDAARALTPPGLIARVAQQVRRGAPAVVPVLPVADTIKRVHADQVLDTPPRAELRAVQTPQGFDLKLLREANQAYFADPQPGFVPTDDASLMEWYGVPVTCVAGDPMAFKITTPIDLRLATSITDEAEPTIFNVPGGRS